MFPSFTPEAGDLPFVPDAVAIPDRAILTVGAVRAAVGRPAGAEEVLEAGFEETEEITIFVLDELGIGEEEEVTVELETVEDRTELEERDEDETGTLEDEDRILLDETEEETTEEEDAEDDRVDDALLELLRDAEEEIFAEDEADPEERGRDEVTFAEADADIVDERVLLMVLFGSRDEVELAEITLEEFWREEVADALAEAFRLPVGTAEDEMLRLEEAFALAVAEGKKEEMLTVEDEFEVIEGSAEEILREEVAFGSCDVVFVGREVLFQMIVPLG